MTQRFPLRIFCVCLACLLLCSLPLPALPASAVSSAELNDCIQGVISWKKADNGSSEDGFLINDAFLEAAGTTAGDWYPFALGRAGIADNQQGYLAVIADNISSRYRQSGKLSANKSTEWHRIALAVAACGGNPRAIGTDASGHPIDLIADGTYDRGKTVSLGRQGINGWIWGLIALDSDRYEIPDGAASTRDDMLEEILCRQLPDGGFALSGSVSDPDMTAMAIQALSPYYNSGKTYSYTRKSDRQAVTKSVREVIGEALSVLSSLQSAEGDYQSWGTKNVESTCQTALALCCLGIDPESDARFIKNGNTLLSAILTYRRADGGFCHSFSADTEDPSAAPGRSNSMASEQVLYTLVAVTRLRAGQRSLYDLRPEWSAALRDRIVSLRQSIDSLSGSTDRARIVSLFDEYKAIPVSERCYIYNYETLAAAMDADAITDDSGDLSGSLDAGNEAAPSDSAASAPRGNAKKSDAASAGTSDTDAAGADEAEEDLPLLAFTAEDRAAVDALPPVEQLTTQYYSTVLTLRDKLDQSDDFDGRTVYSDKLDAALTRIRELQAEIDSINEAIRDTVYPFEHLTRGDKSAVLDILRRCDALGAYDLAKIQGYDDVKRAKTQIETMERTQTLFLILFAVVLLLTPLTVWRILRRRKKKRLAKLPPVEEESEEDSPRDADGLPRNDEGGPLS